MNSTGLLGRARERAAIGELLAPGDGGLRVLALAGESGSGRTALVALAGEAALADGRRFLTVSGRRGEERVPLSGLSHLLVPFAAQIETLPDAHRTALGRPLGLVSDTTPFDLVAMGMAVLALMTQRPEASPLLVAVDDADFVDAETLSVLAFVATRMDRRKAVLLLAAEPKHLPPQFDRNAKRLRIGRLTETDARALLDRQGLPLSAAVRARIVEQSAGSPLALLETAAAAVLSGTPHRPTRDPLRVGPIIEERVLERYRFLPVETQKRLVDAAVALSCGGPQSGASPVLPDELASLGPAERAGMVVIDHSGVRFVHPGFWIAIFHTTPFAERVESHGRVAASLDDEPDRRAWHLGHGAVEPDEEVAALLESRASTIGQQIGRLGKALALERAAEISPDVDDRARRLLAAAATAAPLGELAWVEELTARAAACVHDPALRVRAIMTAAYAAAARGRFSAAMSDLSRAAVDAVDSAPESAWEVLSIAAAVGYQSGSRATKSQMEAAAHRLASSEVSKTPFADARSLWIDSYLRPGIDTSARIATLDRLRALGPTDESSLSRLAGAAWFDDESETAFGLADAAYDRLVAQSSFAAAALLGPIRSWTSFETGHWDDALVYGADGSRVAEAAGGGMLQSVGDSVAALVQAARGDVVASEASVQAALALIEGEECLSTAARAHQARGLAGLASGDYAAAYSHLSHLFREDGAPLHWHISYFGVGDLASAALRSDQVAAARILLGHIVAELPTDPAVRLRHVMLRARALLAESDDAAERFFEEARTDAAGSRWPFERAQLLLDYGSWLRRRRRVGEAKPLLAQAHDLFDRLGAQPWKLLAGGELRASHVDVARPAGSLGELTGQQREIVLLAGRGLTNREIAARLYLSPRTVASHLYRAFPKLGIRDRWQLRDLIDDTSRASDTPELV